MLRFRLVCATWAAAMDSSPELWHTVEPVLENGRILNYGDVFFGLKHSQQAALTIAVHEANWSPAGGSGVNGVRGGEDLAELVGASAGRASRLVVKTPSALDLLLSAKWPRVTDLVLKKSFGDGFREEHAGLWSVVERQLPMLRVVTVEDTVEWEAKAWTDMASFPAMLLRTVRLRGSAEDLRAAVGRFGGARAFAVTLSGRGGQEWCPLKRSGLVELSVTTRRVDALLAGITFPDLLKLHVTLALHARKGGKAFERAQLPGLKILSLEWGSTLFSGEHPGVFTILGQAPAVVHLVLTHTPFLADHYSLGLASADFYSREHDHREPFYVRPCDDAGFCDGFSLCDHFLGKLAGLLPRSVATLELRNACITAGGLRLLLVRSPSLCLVRVGWRFRMQGMKLSTVEQIAREAGVRVIVDSLGLARD